MIDVKQLEALLAVVEHTGFVPAAKALGISVAAVSQRVKALETDMGQRLITRGKHQRLTGAGQALLAHARQVRWMEADLLAQLKGDGQRSKRQWQTLSVAVNADSLASWFLPGVAETVRSHRLLLDILIDDQDHTHAALEHGDVVACVSTLEAPMRGCRADPLGVMRYVAVASEAVAARCQAGSDAERLHLLLREPAVIFNRKDGLQDVFLYQRFGVSQASYPRHFAPAVDAFEAALVHGMGWGMVPEVHLAQCPGLQPVYEGAGVDVALYWHHWAQEPLAARHLTDAVMVAARSSLRPLRASGD
ncbi:HTH-type transcriptional regulator ArgP [Hydrogenophaga sp. 5NK40-0174]|uniref:HTH-type transcriptional regulator ArgP n=1 Tax=Hydrogenophaga sp. 5NK40-0174 TaxID=3127649 RepID=UPI003103B891